MQAASTRRLPGIIDVFGGLSMQPVQHCSNCLAEARIRRRDFSEQVWSMLLVWGEIGEKSVDQMICDDCYRDLREVLIERSVEMERALKTGNLSLSAALEARRSADAEPKAPAKKGASKVVPAPAVAAKATAAPSKKPTKRSKIAS